MSPIYTRANTHTHTTLIHNNNLSVQREDNKSKLRLSVLHMGEGTHDVKTDDVSRPFPDAV